MRQLSLFKKKSKQSIFVRLNTIFIFKTKPLLCLSVYNFNSDDDVVDRRFGNWDVRDKRVMKLWDWLIKKNYPEAETGEFEQNYRWFVKIV